MLRPPSCKVIALVACAQYVCLRALRWPGRCSGTNVIKLGLPIIGHCSCPCACEENAYTISAWCSCSLSPMRRTWQSMLRGWCAQLSQFVAQHIAHVVAHASGGRQLIIVWCKLLNQSHSCALVLIVRSVMPYVVVLEHFVATICALGRATREWQPMSWQLHIMMFASLGMLYASSFELIREWV